LPGSITPPLSIRFALYHLTLAVHILLCQLLLLIILYTCSVELSRVVFAMNIIVILYDGKHKHGVTLKMPNSSNYLVVIAIPNLSFFAFESL